jgi:hypothetical protein
VVGSNGVEWKKSEEHLACRHAKPQGAQNGKRVPEASYSVIRRTKKSG